MTDSKNVRWMDTTRWLRPHLSRGKNSYCFVFQCVLVTTFVYNGVCFSIVCVVADQRWLCHHHAHLAINWMNY